MEKLHEKVKVNFEILNLKDLEETKGNPQKMEGHVFAGLVESMKEKGWILDAPVVWQREDGIHQIISGHHRIKAGIEAGIIQTGCKVISGLTDKQAKIFLLEANQRRGNLDDLEFERFINDILKDNQELTIESLYRDVGVETVDPFDDNYIEEIINTKEVPPENEVLSITIKFKDLKEKEEFIETLDHVGGRTRNTEYKIKQLVTVMLRNIMKEDRKLDKQMNKEK